MALWEYKYGCLERRRLTNPVVRIPDSFVVKLDFPASGEVVPFSCSAAGVGDTNSWYFVFSRVKSSAVHSQSFLLLFVVAQLFVFFLVLVVSRTGEEI